MFLKIWWKIVIFSIFLDMGCRFQTKPRFWVGSRPGLDSRPSYNSRTRTCASVWSSSSGWRQSYKFQIFERRIKISNLRKIYIILTFFLCFFNIFKVKFILLDIQLGIFNHIILWKNVFLKLHQNYWFYIFDSNFNKYNKQLIS